MSSPSHRPQSQPHTMARPHSAQPTSFSTLAAQKRLPRGALREAPPEVIRRSPLYGALPEARLHAADESGGILERLRRSGVQAPANLTSHMFAQGESPTADKQQHHHEFDEEPSAQHRHQNSGHGGQTTATTSTQVFQRPSTAAPRATSTSFAARQTPQRAGSASAVRRSHSSHKPAWDGDCGPTDPTSPLGRRRPASGSAKRSSSTPANNKSSGSSAEPLDKLATCATEHMVVQRMQVTALEQAMMHERAVREHVREARWAEMREAQEAKERRERLEAAKRRQRRQAEILAREKVREQKLYERTLLQHQERVARSDIEREQRRTRREYAIELWTIAADIDFFERTESLVDTENVARLKLMAALQGELETRVRAHWQRLYTVTRTQVLSLEKVERVGLAKYLNARAQWKAALDAQLNAFFAQERKVRQKVYDEEAFRFIELDSARQAVVLEEAREKKRIADARAAALREFELGQKNERQDFERQEADSRTHVRNDEVTVRNVIRTDFAEEKKQAHERYKKRLQREKTEWEQACARQQQPVFIEEADLRGEIDHEWNREFNTLWSTQRQERDELAIPVVLFATHETSAFDAMARSVTGSPPGSPLGRRSFVRGAADPASSPGPDRLDAAAAPSNAGSNNNGNTVLPLPSSPSGAAPRGHTTTTAAYCTQGTPCALFPMAAFACKTHKSFAKYTVAGALASVRISQGACLGDDVDLAVPRVAAPREKVKGAMLRATYDGVVLDEENTQVSFLTKNADAPDDEMDDGAADTEEQDDDDQAGGVGEGVAAPPLAVLDFTFPDGTEMPSAEVWVMKCLRSLAFRCSPTNTNLRERTIDVELKVACGKAPKNKSRRCASFGSPQSKTTYEWFTLIMRCVVMLRPPVIRAIPCGSPRLAVLFDVRKRASGSTKAAPVPLLPGATLAHAPNAFCVAGALLKLRFVDGWTPDDIIAVQSGDGFNVKKTEIRSDGQPFVKVVGKFQTASAKEVTFNFNADNGVVLGQSLERFLRRIQYGTLAEGPPRATKTIELVYEEPRSAPDGPRSFACRIDVVVTGTSDEHLAAVYDPTEATVFRDCLSTASTQWKKFLTADAALVCPHVTLEGRGNLGKDLPLPGGSIRAAVTYAARPEDALSIQFDAGVAAGLGTLHRGTNGAVLFAEAKAPRRRSVMFDDDPESLGDTAHDLNLDLVNHSSASPTAKGTPIAKIVSQGRSRLLIDLIPGPELKLAVVQLLLRSIAFSSTPAPDAMGSNKLVAIDVTIADTSSHHHHGSKHGGSSSGAGSHKRAAAAPASTSHGRGAAASVDMNGHTRVYRQVQVRPSVIRSHRPLISLPRLATPQVLEGLRIASDALEDRYDGGYLRLDFVDGRSAFEQLTFTGPERDAASPLANNTSATAAPEDDKKAKSDDDDGTSSARSGSPASGEPGTSIFAESQPMGDVGFESASDLSTDVEGGLEAVTAGIEFIAGGGGSDVALVDSGHVVGTVAESAPGRPLVLRFARSTVPLGQQSTSTAATSSTAAAGAAGATGGLHRGLADVPFPVLGRHVRACLKNLWYQHSDADSMLDKAIRITAQDAYGRRSQAVVGLHIEPNFCPTICVNPPTTVYFRHRAYPILMNDMLPIFEKSDLEDDDTENVGRCIMSLEPYDGVTADDVVDLARPGPSWPAAMRRLTLVEHPVDPSKTTICYDGREVAWCVNKPHGDADAPSGNALYLTIKTGTALTVCTLIMRLLAYHHKESQPRRNFARQYEFRFNAGDEDVPDTRVVFAVYPNPPLLSVLPIHTVQRFREGTSGAALLMSPMLGIALNTPCSGDVIRVTLNQPQREDLIDILPVENLLVDDRYLVATLAYARQLSPSVNSATPGVSGVAIGTIRRMSDTVLEIPISRSCPLPSAVVPAVLRSIVFKNTSNDPSDVPREALITWYRNKTKECGYVTIEVSVEPEDDMTEVELPATVVSALPFEECRFALGAIVTDADTPLFEPGSNMECEVQGAGCELPVTLTVNTGDFRVDPDSKKLLYGTREIGMWHSEPPRHLRVDFTDCPLEVLELLVNALSWTSTDKQRTSRVIQLTIRGSPQVTPTIVNVQVNVFPRAVAFVSNALTPYVIDSGPQPLFAKNFSVASASFSGAVITLGLATPQNMQTGGVAAAVKRPKTAGVYTPTPTPPDEEKLRAAIPGVDKLSVNGELLEDEAWVLNKNAIQTRTGQLICSFDSAANGSTLSISFPRATKVPASTVSKVMALVCFESGAAQAAADAASSPMGKSGRLSRTMSSPKVERTHSSSQVGAAGAGGDTAVAGHVKLVVSTQVIHLENSASQLDYRFIDVKPAA